MDTQEITPQDIAQDLSTARSEIQLLQEKYADYDSIKNERDQIKKDFGELCEWIQEQLLATDASVTTIKSALTTKLQSELSLQDQLNEAQKSLHTEQLQHQQDLQNDQREIEQLRQEIQDLQKKCDMLTNRIDQLDQVVLGHTDQIHTVNIFQKALVSLQQLFERG